MFSNWNSFKKPRSSITSTSISSLQRHPWGNLGNQAVNIKPVLQTKSLNNVYNRKTVYLGPAELEGLKSIFDSCVYYDPSHVNLRSFIHAVSKSTLLQSISTPERALQIKMEILKMDSTNAMIAVSWLYIEKLMEKETYLRLPIASSKSIPASESREKYAILLQQLGIRGFESVQRASQGRAVEPSVDRRGSAGLVAMQGSLAAQHNEVRRVDIEAIERVDKLIEAAREKAISGVTDTMIESDEEEENMGITDDDNQNLLQALQQALIEYRFTPLSQEEQRLVASVLNGPDNLEELIEKFNIPINRNKIRCLRQGIWLNDEVRSDCAICSCRNIVYLIGV
jgi:hypothetical protein